MANIRINQLPPGTASLTDNLARENTSDIDAKISVEQVGDVIAPLTAKGDLLTRNASNKVVLPVGTDGFILTANSAASEGIEWASGGGSGDVTGPASSQDNEVSVYNSTTGKIIKNSGLLVDVTTPTFFTNAVTYMGPSGNGITVDPSGYFEYKQATKSLQVGGGNNPTGTNSVCLGGVTNNAIPDNSSTIGGSGNLVSAGCPRSSIVGGRNSEIKVNSPDSIILSGNANTIENSIESSIISGSSNIINAASISGSAILTGNSNSVVGSASAIIYGGGCSIAGDTTLVGGNGAQAIGSSNNSLALGEAQITGKSNYAAFKFTNGYDFQATTGDFKFSAAGVTADGDLDNSQLNWSVVGDNVQGKYKNSGGTVFSFTLPSAGTSAFVKLATINASAATSVDFANLTTAYKKYIIHAENIVPGTNDAQLYFRVSTDNGATFISSAGAYRFSSTNTADDGSSNPNFSQSATQVEISQALGNTSTIGHNFTIEICDPANSSFNSQIYWSGHERTDNLDLDSITNGSGRRVVAEANDAVRLIMSAGNISGNFTLYGLVP